MSILWQLRSILRKNDPAPEPLGPQAKASASSLPVERRIRKRINTHKGRRVLIVDDSPTIIAALKKILRSAGCATLEALDAESGLETLRREKPDLVFLDIVLPGMNGFAALRLMRRDPQTQGIPVIMISGNEQATEQFYAKRIGADDFMKKPFSRHEVFARIEGLIEAKKLPQLKAGDSTLKTAAKASPESVLPALSLPPSAPQKAPTPEIVEAAESADKGMPQESPKQPEQVTASKRPLTPLEARTQLTAMGLQYFNQEQFLAAIERGDALAIELFMLGGGVDTEA